MTRFWLITLIALLVSPAAAAEADNSAALALFREGRYAAAYTSFWPALSRGDPEAVFHGLIIRRNGLDGRPPAQAPETAALMDILAGRVAFMRQALDDKNLPETTADAYRTALAQLLYAGKIPLDHPPDSPEDYPASRRKEAMKMISGFLPPSPTTRFPPAMNFAAHLNLDSGGSAQKARGLLRKSAEAGDRLGMINLSLFYREGLGGARSDLQAAQWARQAASSEPPLARALNEVGYFYETGRGVTRDLAEARTWYGKSAARGYQPGRNNAARLNAKDPPQSRPALEEKVLF